MAGAMRKVGVYLGLLEDSDRYEDELRRRRARADAAIVRPSGATRQPDR